MGIFNALSVVLEETGSANNPFRYAGYEYDSETGLYYLKARFYSASLARFMQEDTYRGQKDDPLSLNLYSYSNNNPLTYYDPTGHAAVPVTVALCDGTWKTGYLENGVTKMADGSKPPLYSGVFTPSGGVWGVTATGSIKMVPNATVKTPGKANQDGYIIGGTTYLANGQRPANNADVIDKLTGAVYPMPGSSTKASTSKSGTSSTKNQQTSTNTKASTDVGSTVHTVLDVGGFLGPVGPFADVANAVYYLAEKDYKNAGLSLVGAVPFVGDGIKGVKTGTKIVNAVSDTKAMTKTAKAIESAGKSLTGYGAKSESYLTKRGWTWESAQNIVKNPYTTREAVNKATGNPATVFYNKAGDYVVRDNITGELVQTSKFGDVNWIPDSSIINPYRP